MLKIRVKVLKLFENPRRTVYSFFLSGLYSPRGWIVRKIFIRAYADKLNKRG